MKGLRVPGRIVAALALAAAALAAITPSAGFGAPEAATSAVRPSIVVVLTDDQRRDTMWAMPTVKADLIDRGINFSNAFIPNPLCCPSRASILTGKFSHSTGVWLNGGTHGGFGAFDDSSTLATWLDAAGYRTALIGKYLNGYCGDAGSYVPPGWDRWFAFMGYSGGGCGQGDFYNYNVSVDGHEVVYGNDASDYSTDVLAAEGISFIRSTPQEQPLFLFLSLKAPHKPATPAPRHSSAFSDLSAHRPPNYNEADVSDKPAWVRKKKLLSSTTQATIDALRKDQLRTLLAVDEAVGSVVDALEQTGRLSSTMVVFASDNGYHLGEHRLTEKGTPYDETTRVPLVVRYDPLTQTPRQDARLVLNIDLAPTFADLAGVSAPGSDGKTILPLLQSTTATWRSDFLLEHLRGAVPSYCGVRNRRYSYVRYGSGEEELYDMARDPYQLRNKAKDAAYATTLGSMRLRTRKLCKPPPPGYTF